MKILNAIFFQLKCLFLGIGIDIENVADERAIEPAVGQKSNTNSIRPEIGRGSGRGSWKMFNDSH